jgi:hypothetical protein
MKDGKGLSNDGSGNLKTVFVSCNHIGSTLTATERGARPQNILERISTVECGGRCEITCEGASSPPHGSGAKLLTSDVPDEIFENYFTFSFVREPFDRSLSSFAEAARGDMFSDALRGTRNGNSTMEMQCMIMCVKMADVL